MERRHYPTIVRLYEQCRSLGSAAPPINRPQRMHRRLMMQTLADPATASPDDVREILPSKEGTISCCRVGKVNNATPNLTLRRRIGTWSNDSLHKALDVVIDDGMKVKVATQKFGIPATSLGDMAL